MTLMDIRGIIQQIVRLQDLLDAQEQTTLAGNAASTEGLDRIIEKTRKQLPKEENRHIEKLLRRGERIIAPVHNACCTGCGISLTPSALQDVRQLKKLSHCTSCSRILYIPETVPQGSSPLSGKAMARKSGIDKYSSPALMMPHIAAMDTEALISCMAERLGGEGYIDDTKALTQMALEREKIVTTAVQNGIAFPHVRGIEGSGLIMALGTSRKGFRFCPDAKTLSKIFFFMIVPTAASAFYLKLLSGLSKALSTADKRRQLLAAKEPLKLWKALRETTQKEIS